MTWFYHQESDAKIGLHLASDSESFGLSTTSKTLSMIVKDLKVLLFCLCLTRCVPQRGLFL